MATTNYLALLRGINVGGKNIIKMSDLRACLQELQFSDVTTYIQSGNVVFRSPAKKQTLEPQIENKLSVAFDYASTVVVISHSQLKRIIETAPPGFGHRPEEFKYDVAFLKSPLTAQKVLERVSLREEVDRAYAGKTVVYFSRFTSRAAQSRLNRLASLPIYHQMTIRNWNTVTKLAALLDEL